jgi:hypothetical protein
MSLIASLVSGCGKSYVVPLPELPPDITSYDDNSVPCVIELPPDIPMTLTFWNKVTLIAGSAITIFYGVFMCYDIVMDKRQTTRFEQEEREFKCLEIEAACQRERQRCQAAEQRNRAGHQVNHPGYRIGSSKD